MPITHGTPSGYTSGKCRCEECKAAHRAAAARFKAKDPDAFNAKRRAKYAEDPAAARAAQRRWEQANPDKIKEYDRRKRERHAVRLQEYFRARYLLNKQAYIDKASRWRKENPEAAKASSDRTKARYRDEYNRRAAERARVKYAEDPQKFRDRFNAWAQTPAGRRWFHDQRARRRAAAYTEEALDWLESLTDPLCTYCGEPADSIDHIIPVAKGGTGERDNITPACMTCNRRKHTMSAEAFLRRLENEKETNAQ